MKNEFIKLKQLKIALQMYKTALNKMDACKDSFSIYSYGEYEIAILSKRKFFALCNTLKISPIIIPNYMSPTECCAYIYYEGINNTQ